MIKYEWEESYGAYLVYRRNSAGQRWGFSTYTEALYAQQVCDFLNAYKVYEPNYVKEN